MSLPTEETERLWRRQQALATLAPQLAHYLSAGASAMTLSSVLESLWDLRGEDLDRALAAQVLWWQGTDQMLREAHRVVSRLPNSMRHGLVELRGEVRGRLQAARTLERRARTQDPTLFVCRVPETPQASARARLVHAALLECVSAARRARLKDTGATGRHVAGCRRAAQRILQHPKLARLDARLGVSDAEVARAEEQHATQGIARFLRCARALRARAWPTPQAPGLLQTLLAPPKDDKLFELQVAFRMIDTLEALGFERGAPGLLAAGSRPLASMTRGSERVRLWWQRHPLDELPADERHSPYRAALLAAGMRPSMLRPDFLLSHQPSGRSVVVEVKHTTKAEPADERQGVAEVLAYLHDAADAVGQQPPPRGLVVAWGGKGRPAHSDVVVTDYSHLSDAMSLVAQSWC